jgi:alkylated DNA repair dioxygenase AlkB
MWKRPGTNVQYVPSAKPVVKNEAAKYAKTMVRSELDKHDPNINKEYNMVINDGAFYLPNFFETTSDRTIFNQLKHEIESAGCDEVAWSKHFKYENPTNLKIVNYVVAKMEQHFGIDVHHCRLNYYKDETSYKPLHKDQNAYGDHKGNFTMGASFGDTRALQLVHDKTGMKFNFPQNNGDIFAFNQDVNKAYMHGVPKTNKKVGERFSIIAWGSKIDKNHAT